MTSSTGDFVEKSSIRRWIPSFPSVPLSLFAFRTLLHHFDIKRIAPCPVVPTSRLVLDSSHYLTPFPSCCNNIVSFRLFVSISSTILLHAHNDVLRPVRENRNIDRAKQPRVFQNRNSSLLPICRVTSPLSHSYGIPPIVYELVSFYL